MNEAAFGAWAETLNPAPHVRIQCPRRHHLVTVGLERRDDGKVVLKRAVDAARDLAATGTAVSGWENISGGGGIADDRVALRCDLCRYRGIKIRASLLEQYAHAVMTRRDWITLTD
jgi:hypothetical protein